ncbi:protein ACCUMULATION AND REPLICATION OF CHLOROPLASTS 6, chloroplastic isoform X1 [Ananas comosus]|uniref:Protein ACCUMULATION AND REPLICATION OF CHLOROPLASTS 6, chloroplastic n=1 Tax=Ananas comosus TaxID=4615 RepID=A0A199USK7_ANACO|nr:protein ACCUMULATION AND REPLICATION OF CHLOROPLASTS 6, chloroplastic isoform X1 [Ananas comosus]OAY67739.1 Protein ACCUMULATION AND REPLICATION OF CHLOROPLASTS 6, chloroplastic [Ananas comosus]
MEALNPLLPPPPLLRKPHFFPTKLRKPSSFSSKPYTRSTICRSSKWAERLLGDFHFLPSTSAPDSPPPSAAASNAALLSLFPPSAAAASDRAIPLPIDFYKILGAEPHFLADGIRRAFEARLSKPPQYGFSAEALIGRRQILQAACDALSNPSSRSDYNRGLVEDNEATAIVDVSWDKVPGALCVLQEAGETEVVLKIGGDLLLERLPKPFKQDVVLAMALAYVDLSRDAMALSPPDFVKCCEVLERALKLLQEEGASNLAPDLLVQIDETLEEITPRCVLELLALPLDGENQIKREEGLRGVRNILWTVGKGGAAAIGGRFTREDFMNEAFLRMTSAEQIDLFTATPSSIPPERFEVYSVALAYVAQAVISKKPYLILTAEGFIKELQSSDNEIDLALERGLCSLLVGDLDNCRKWLGIDNENSQYRDPEIVEFIVDNSYIDQDNDLLPGVCKLLETWLVEVVFPRCRDTEDIQFRLGDYYDDPTVLRHLERMEGGGSSPLAAAAAIAKIGAEATAALGTVKSSALQAFRKVFPPVDKEENSILDEPNNGHESEPVTKLQSEGLTGGIDQENSNFQSEAIGKQNSADPHEQDLTYYTKDATVKIMSAGVVVVLLTVAGMKYLPRRRWFPVAKKELGSAMAANVVDLGVPVDENLTEEVPRMDARLAETLVRKWQNIKSLALGPDHSLAQLKEVLEGRMLKIWTDRVAEIAQHGWFWEYTLLGVTIDSVTVSLDGRRATVEATIEEAAKLTDVAHSEHNDSYTATYTTRYEMSHSNTGWKITEGAVLKS